METQPKATDPGAIPVGGALLWRQLFAMTRLSAKRYVRSRHFWAPLVLMFLPVLMILVRAVFLLVGSGFAFTDPLPPPVISFFDYDNQAGAHETGLMFQTILLTGYLRFAVIFSAMIFGNSAMREELEEQTLHYLFLQPIPRYLIVVGKLLGFVFIGACLLVVALVSGQFLLLLPYGPSAMAGQLFGEGRLVSLVTECGVMVVALLMYSVFFMALSVFFKNFFYALAVYGWEQLTSWLPTTLKNFSLTFYFTHMFPDAAVKQTSIFEVMSVPPGALQTILVLGIMFVVCVVVSFWQLSQRECVYGSN